MFERDEPSGHFGGLLIEPLDIDENAALFHVGEHFNQRQFERIVEVEEMIRAEPLQHLNADLFERRAQTDRTARLEQVIHQINVIKFV